MSVKFPKNQYLVWMAIASLVLLVCSEIAHILYPALMRDYFAGQLGLFQITLVLGTCLVLVKQLFNQSRSQINYLVSETKSHEVYTHLKHNFDFALSRQANFAVMILDVDDFTVINQSLGEELGSQLLDALKNRLTEALPYAKSGVTVSRSKGDEFIISLSHYASEKHLERVIYKLLKRLQQAYQLQHHEIFINVSVGVACCPGDGKTLADLLKAALIAMFHTKYSGKNGYSFYNDGQYERISRRFSLIKEMRKGLARGEFEVYYQPKVNLNTRSVTGMEALLRWNHPKRGLLGPGVFLKAAEQSDVIVELSDWVLRDACQRCVAWQSEFDCELTLSVNLSQRQFRHESFLQNVKVILEQTGLRPASLEMELSESMLMIRDKYTISTLQALKEIGVRLSVDDYGTAYSPIHRLSQYPIDIIKIDRSQISGLGQDSNDQLTVDAIIKNAHKMNISVTAAGVENQEQCAYLEKSVCDDIQGYLVSKPLKADDLTAFLRESIDMGKPSTTPPVNYRNLG